MISQETPLPNVPTKEKKLTKNTTSNYGRQRSELHLRTFCHEYLLNGFNARKASIAIGDKPYYTNTHYLKYLEIPFVKNYLNEHKQKMQEKIEGLLEWKLQKLKKIIDICVPDNATTRNDLYVKGAVLAISELNKMEGDYAPTLSKSTSITKELGKDINYDEAKISKELLEQLEQQYRKDF